MYLRRAKAHDMPKLHLLYREAFPRDERFPFRIMKRRALQGKGDFWMLMDGETFAGMAYVIRSGSLAYLFYLAIEKNSRGKGYGTEAVALLVKQYAGCNLFLARETLDPTSENYNQRLRRHDFYLRCGLKDLPGHIKELSVVFDIMGTGENVNPQDYKAMMHAFAGFPLNRVLDMRML